MELEFLNKTVLITGSSRGIGRAAAQKFAQLSARVVIHYHENRKAAEDTLTELPGGPHLIVQADISNPDSVQNMMDTVLKETERIHVLVNNAGIFEEYPILDLTYEEWQKVWERTIRTNLLGPANVSFRMIQHMKAQGGGERHRSFGHDEMRSPTELATPCWDSYTGPTGTTQTSQSA